MLSNIDFEQVLRDGWHTLTTWIKLFYAENPLLAWGITGIILLYLLYRFSRAGQRRAEQRAKRVRGHRRRKPATSNKRKSRNRGHRHDHDQHREDDENTTRRSYRTTKRDKLDDWD